RQCERRAGQPGEARHEPGAERPERRRGAWVPRVRVQDAGDEPVLDAEGVTVRRGGGRGEPKGDRARGAGAGERRPEAARGAGGEGGPGGPAGRGRSRGPGARGGAGARGFRGSGSRTRVTSPFSTRRA